MVRAKELAFFRLNNFYDHTMKGCCGCSLSTSTLTAAVLALVESVVGLAWNILVVVVIEMEKAQRESNIVPKEDISATTTTQSILPPKYLSSNGSRNDVTTWETFKVTLTSKKSLEEEPIFALTVTALVLNSLWFIMSLALAVGNSEKCRDMLKPWILMTVLMGLADIAATIYFIVKATEDDIDVAGLRERIVLENLYVLCAILFSRGGPIIWIINVAMVYFVWKRIKEIEQLKKKRLPFDSDVQITPCTYPIPYEAYEADSSPRTPNGHRPNTPPPDYEGGLGRKSHRLSYPTDYESLTLPAASVRSGRSLVADRQRAPSRSSYGSDDRVELQQRASAADNILNHAYENKALEMEPEGWMGIPRPTLKTTR